MPFETPTINQEKKIKDMSDDEIRDQIEKYKDQHYSHSRFDTDSDKHLAAIAETKLQELNAEKNRREGQKPKAETSSPQKPSELSDEEIDIEIERANKERQSYWNMQEDQIHRPRRWEEILDEKISELKEEKQRREKLKK